MNREAVGGLFKEMYFSISDSMVSEFLSGLFVVFALVAVGGTLSLILGNMAKRFPFTRLALVLALAPFSLVRFLDRSGSSTLFLYSMIVLLLGITIDGINYLLTPKAAPETKAKEAEEQEEPAPGMIVWEKAE
ncbi:MAG: hypothetical protein U9P12_00660 [Verrucomicrobiota bacterium]|nr:hypothetical protein [Verrucomicrobiota bacterium]